ncbi:MAG: cytochrome c3 family protein [bacterium]|nr:cytochrome c3 family protein [bacterium]
MNQDSETPLIFPKWLDSLRPVVGGVLGVLPIYLLALAYLGGSPQTTDVGYRPEQPIPYSHRLHVGELGIDCRYCHSTVEQTAHAALPPTETCMNCHANIHTESEKLLPVRESYSSGLPVRWVRVHDLPDYVYFNHSAHVTRGVACVSCHDRVDTMEVVYQAQPLSMGWCLDCHRNPEPNLRPPEYVTQMDWQPDPNVAEHAGSHIRETYDINPSEDCSTCHR